MLDTINAHYICYPFEQLSASNSQLILSNRIAVVCASCMDLAVVSPRVLLPLVGSFFLYVGC